jgi:hypothetical protein
MDATMEKKGRKPRERKGYFYEREENAIVTYLRCGDEETRQKVYNDIIHPAFTKMIESIIRRYRLYVPEEQFEQLFNDTISYLMTKLNNFKPEKGYKAFSYCGTICKNYLIQRRVQYSKEQQRNISYDTVADSFENNEDYATESDEYFDVAEKLIIDTSKEIGKMISNPSGFSLNDDEIKVGLALIDLLNNWEDKLAWDNDDSNKLQKSEVLYFLRESTLMTTKAVRDNMKKFRGIYYLLKRNILENE